MAPLSVLPPVNSAHRIHLEPIATPSRLLLGPGPSNAHPTVLAALARTPIGHLDPLYIQLMGEVQELLRYAWQTDNRLTLPMSGTGSAAMEATIANVVEPGDKVLVAVMGYFGLRQADMAQSLRRRGGHDRAALGGGLQLWRSSRRLSSPTGLPCWPWCTRRPPPGSASPWRALAIFARDMAAYCFWIR